MEKTESSLLIHGATITDIEELVGRVVDARIQAFYESIRNKPDVLVRRKEAARRIGVSLPTLDAYARAGILHSRHIGGRVFFLEDELAVLDGIHAVKLLDGLPHQRG